MRSVLMLLGIVLAFLAQAYFARRANVNDAIILYAVAGVMLAGAIGPAAWPGGFGEGQPDTPAPVAPRDRWRGGVALALSALLATAASFQMAANWARSFDDSVILLCLSAVLAAYGFSRREGWRFAERLHEAAHRLRSSWWEVALVAAIVAWGAFMRLWQLGYFPPAGGVGIVDEPQMGKIVMDIYAGQRPWQFPTLVYPAYALFKLLGPSLEALRLSPILSGIATLVPFYLLARLFVGRPAAFAATFLFAASRWHASTNRMLLAINPETFVAVLAMYLLYRGWKGGGSLSFLLGGGMAVAGLYGYAGYRIVPLTLAALIALLLAVAAARAVLARGDENRRRSFAEARAHVRGLGLYVVGAAVVGLPFFRIVQRDPVNSFTERFTSVLSVPRAASGEIDWAGLGQRLRDALLIFNLRGDGSPLYNLPDAPMLDPLSGVLFALALVCALFYAWRGFTALPLLWFAATLIGGAVLTTNLQTYRILGILPAVFLLIAFLLDGVWQRARIMLPPQRGWLAGGALVAVLAVASYANVDIFFNQQVHSLAVRREFIHPTEMTAAYLARQTGRPYVHLVAAMPFFSPGMDYAWIAGFPRGKQEPRLVDILPHRQDDGQALYVFSQPYSDTLAAQAVRQFYSDAVCDSEYSPWNSLLYVACRVSAADVQGRRGLTARYYSGDSTGGEPALMRTDHALDFTWSQNATPLPGRFSVAWQGAFYIAQSEGITLSVASTAPFTVSVGGVTLSTSGPARQVVRLPQGWHALSATLYNAIEGDVTRLLLEQQEKLIPVDATHFARLAEVHGLLARFYTGPSWQGVALAERIDPFMEFMALPEGQEGRPSPRLPEGPFSAEWSATLTIAEPGTYRFRAGAMSGQSEVWIDSRSLARTDMASYNQMLSADGEAYLQAGSHVVRLRYSYKEGHVARAWLYWAAPGHEIDMIPYQALTPLPR